MNKGQSLFELIVAVGVAGFVLISLMSLAVRSVANSTYSKNKSLATRYTQEGMEWLRALRDADWDDFVSLASRPRVCLNSLSANPPSGSCGSSTISGTVFSREVDFVHNSGSASNPETIEVTITTSWIGSSNKRQQSQASTTFTNWLID